MKARLTSAFLLALLAGAGTSLAVPAVPAEAGVRVELQNPARLGQQGKRALRRGAIEAKAAQNPDLAAMLRMVALERIYRKEGKLGDVDALYRDVLSRSTSASVKNFAELRLARLQMRAGDRASAKQTLRSGLERNLQAPR